MESTAPHPRTHALDGALLWVALAALLVLARGLAVWIEARGGATPAGEHGAWVALETANAGWPAAAVLALVCTWIASRTRRPTAILVALAAVAAVVVLRLPMPAAEVAIGPSASFAASLFTAFAVLTAAGRAARIAGPLWLVVALACAPLARRAAPVVEARTIAVDVIAEESAWSVVRERDDAPVEIAAITPSFDTARAHEDMPSLVMPPTAEVEFTVPVSATPLQLHARAGIARRVRAEEGEEQGRDLAPLLPDGEVVRVRFQMEVDGELLFDAVGEWRDDESSTWMDVAGTGGVALRTGQTVRLRTLAVEGSAQVPAIVQPGFTHLQLERVERHPARLASPDAPNIVFVVMDTLRADRTTIGGADRDLTPNLARLAARGTTYANAYATSPWTWPSTASLLTGMQPNTHGVLSGPESYLDSRIETLAELLQGRGYVTGAIVGNPLIVRAQNFDQGFQHFRSTASGVFVDSDVLVPEAVEWLRANAPARRFLYLHLVDPHEPHDPTEAAYDAVGAGDAPHDYPRQGLTGFKFQLNRLRRDAEPGDEVDTSWITPEHREWMQSSYDAAVWTGDWWLGKLLDELDALGMRENTIVVFTSDHGEELLDHGHVEHTHALWSELVRVPLVIAGPGFDAGKRVETRISNRHVMPTLAKIGDVRPRQVGEFLDLANTDELGNGRVFFSTAKGIWGVQTVGSLYGVTEGEFVLHYAPEALAVDDPERAGDWRLFDLGADPRESRDLSREQAVPAQAMRELILLDLAAQHERRFGGHLVSGQATLEMLRAIGYVGDGESPDDE